MPEKPVRSVIDPGTVTTRQTITPAGVPSVFDGRVYGVAFGSTDADLWVLNATKLYRLDWQKNAVWETVNLGGTPGLQSLVWDAGRNRALIGTAARGGNRNDPVGVQLASVADGRKSVLADRLGTFIAGAIGLARQDNGAAQHLAVVPLIANNKAAVVDVKTGQLVGSANTGIAPFGAVVSRDGSVAYVSNWGGRLPKPGEPVAPTGLAKDADKVVVDVRGVAATGTVTRVDLKTFQATHTIPVELHPTGIVWDEARRRLYVANSNKDSVSVIDTGSQKIVKTIAIQPFAQMVTGIAPTALAITPDGAGLLVACGGINAVAVVDTGSGKLQGLIPTAWYPNALALSQDGNKLAVGSLLGAGSGWRDAPGKKFVHAYRGAVAVVDMPDAAQLASYSTAVAENNHMRLAGPGGAAVAAPVTASTAKPAAVPARSGDPSPIEHVVYIIKENRTYDQVFGDMPQGNGDPSLVMFGREVTPNHHKLAEEFVLLDNLYATGGNSADGHQWVTQANEVAYALWPGYAGRSYPFDGTDPLAYASGGFLWDYALARKKSVKIYGEYIGRLPVPMTERKRLFERWKAGEDFQNEWKVSSPIARVNQLLVPNFPSYSTAIPDVIRARLFLADLKKMEQQGTFPNLTLIQLPSDHTNGAAPNVSTARAMVADNDYAMGQIIEGLSQSKFWPKMAIFVIEDDAQNGVDHVDGHRTVGLVVSPYVRRGHVDSTFYSTQSMVKTMELILGLPTMSLFDLIAHDMRNSFTNTADLQPYRAAEPQISLFEQNPPLSALRGRERQAAKDSMKMRFDVPDAAPTARLNRILWHQVRGWNTPYPGTRNAVFAPLTVEIEDDEREEAER